MKKKILISLFLILGILGTWNYASSDPLFGWNDMQKFKTWIQNQVWSFKQALTFEQAIEVGTTENKTTIDPLTGTTTPYLYSGTPLSTANTEKKVVWWQVVPSSGVTQVGLSIALEMLDATTLKTGATFYAVRGGVEIPIYSTFDQVWGDSGSGASVYISGDKIYFMDKDGTTYDLASGGSGGDTYSVQINNGGVLGGMSFYQTPDGNWWIQDPTSGETIFQNIPGESGVSLHIKGGSIYGMGSTVVYGYVLAGDSAYVLPDADTTLSGDMIRGANLMPGGTTSRILTIPEIDDGSGVTMYKISYLDNAGTGVTIITTEDSGTSIYCRDGTKYTAGTTLWVIGDVASKVVLSPAWTATTGWYWDVQTLIGGYWRLTLTGDDASEVDGTYIGD